MPRLGFVRIPYATQNASLFSCQRSLSPIRSGHLTPGETSARLRSKRVRNNKKPGIERRAKPSTKLDGFARCSIIYYPEFVIDLTSGGYSECLTAPENKASFVRRIESISESFGSSSGAFKFMCASCEFLVGQRPVRHNHVKAKKKSHLKHARSTSWRLYRTQCGRLHFLQGRFSCHRLSRGSPKLFRHW
jgi:hypothetical protein